MRARAILLPSCAFLSLVVGIVVGQGFVGNGEQASADGAGWYAWPPEKGRTVSSGTMGEILQKLRSGEAQEQLAAAAALRNTIDQPIAASLTEALTVAKLPGTRGCLLEVLGNIGAKESLPSVMRIAVDKQEDERVRSLALYALGLLAGKDGVPALIGLMSDKQEPLKVRRMAVTQLGWIGDASAVPELLNILSSGTYSLKMTAASALGHIGDPRAIRPLLAMVGDKDLKNRVPYRLGVALMRLKCKEGVSIYLKYLPQVGFDRDMYVLEDLVSWSPKSKDKGTGAQRWRDWCIWWANNEDKVRWDPQKRKYVVPTKDLIRP